jgi:hypothetical protein
MAVTIDGTGIVSVDGTSTTQGRVRLYEDTDNGTNYVELQAPASVASNTTLSMPSTTATLGYLNIPAVGTQTGSYSIAVGDVGKYVQVGTSGSITIPTGVFSEGDAVMIANNTTGSITITCSAPTAYIAGTNTIKTSMTLATRGVANVFFLSSSVCFVTGNVT